MPFYRLIFLLLVFVLNAYAATKFVKVRENALENVPAPNQKRLVERLDLYLRYFKEENLEQLYGLIHERKKRGLSKESFVSNSKITKEGEYKSFLIEKVKLAGIGEYSDEPTPSPNEGNKWFVNGCMKVKLPSGKTKRYKHSFDIWLINDEWFINRGGFLLGDGGYQDCDSN